MQTSPIKLMEELARTIPGVISLSQGVPIGYSPEIVREDVIKAIRDNKVDRYSQPAGIVEARELLAERLQAQGFNYTAGQLILTAGGLEGLAATVLSLVGPGDEVVVFTPVYSYYQKQIKLARGEVVTIELKEELGWQPKLEDIKQAINSKTKLILVCSPNNPTSTLMNREALELIGELAEQHDAYVVSDEVYRNLYFGEEPAYSLASSERFRPRVIQIFSLSKDFNLTGWRIGSLHLPTELYDQVLATHDTLINCAPVVSQFAALSALTHDQEVLKDVGVVYKRNKDLAAKMLSGVADKLSYVEPEGAFYFFPKITGLTNSMDFCLDAVKKAKVAVVPGSGFGTGGEGHVRICFGRDIELVEEGLQRFIDYLKV